MVLAFDLDSYKTLDQVRDWVENCSREGSRAPVREEARQFMVRVLVCIAYLKLRRSQESLVRRYLEAATGLSMSQVDRLIRQWHQHGDVRDRQRLGRLYARKHTTDQDIDLLARTDRLQIVQVCGVSSRRQPDALPHPLWRAYRGRG